MYEVRLTAEFITPCFCAGSDQERAELRVPSIRGQLRWWCRLLYPGLDKETKLNTKETQLFGSSKEGCSPVKMRVNDIKQSQSRLLNMDPYGALRGYLWFFLQKQSRMKKEAFIADGTSFNLLFSSRDAQALSDCIILSATWLSLGSMGSRSTRAAGCLKLRDASCWGNGCELLKTTVLKINNAAQSKDIITLLSSLYPDSSSVFTIRSTESSASTGLEAANTLAEIWKSLRDYNIGGSLGDQDHNDVIDLLNNASKSSGRKPTIRRAVMGLPYDQIIPSSVSTQNKSRPKLKWEPIKSYNAPTFNRFTSALHLRPLFIKGQLKPSLILFPSILSIFPKKLCALRPKALCDPKEPDSDKIIAPVAMDDAIKAITTKFPRLVWPPK